MTRHTGRRRDQRGVASLEVVALFPVLVLFGTFALQVGAAMWTVSMTNEAARSAARASSLGRDPAAAANASLPDSIQVRGIDVFGGPAHGVRVTARVPRVSPLPVIDVTREAVLP